MITTGNVIGFCNLGSIINDELLRYEHVEDSHPPVAKQILAVMVLLSSTSHSLTSQQKVTYYTPLSGRGYGS